MKNKQYVIGLDIGTTSAKVVLFNYLGNAISEHEIEYPLSHPSPGWVEQNPDEIERAAVKAIHTVVQQSQIETEEIAAVGISAAMHSLICLDKNNNPLSPSITWADCRSVEQTEQLQQGKGIEIYLKTGTPIHPMSPLSKLIWMKENHYEPYLKAKKFVSIKEYLLLKWFGICGADYGIASASGLLNMHTLDWDEEALELAGISREQLFQPVPPTETYQELRGEIAQQMGIRNDLPFVIGSSDGPLANLGIGAISDGDIAITIGTSGAIRQMVSTPQTDHHQETFCYAFTNDMYVIGGPTNNGGIVLRWLKETLGELEMVKALEDNQDPYELLTALAKKVKPGSEGLLFLPFLNGERAPHWNANAKGSYIGLTQSHKKEHLLRAGLEGVIFNIYQIGETLERLSGTSNRLLASGGFARSPLWLQILADIFGKEVYVPESHQSSAWGAAWTALYAVGEVDSFEEIKNFIPMRNSFIPNEKNHEIYKRLYTAYKELYPSLKSHFETLSKLQKN
ncbi:gluconokinase [Bacillus taeanensis]|uniref:Gluconate kinase n=1 Tax=Bacillus taeanensis TaxID=273032 RepID=A0A366XSE0_9BACI|nr:gluconokinase [Bacillus taeanensis]RBW69300.1 gluconate kinase [Bacillus taeanensis]